MQRIEALVVPAGSSVEVFHQHNTGIYLHSPEFRGYDNITQFRPGEGTVMYYWRLKVQAFDEIVRNLMEVNVQMTLNDKPCNTDLDAFEASFGDLTLEVTDLAEMEDLDE